MTRRFRDRSRGILAFAILAGIGTTFLFGQDVDESVLVWDGAVDEEGKIPELGHTFPSGDGFINFRIWQNRIRVYFMDEEEVVIEPPYNVGLVWIRPVGKVREMDRLSLASDRLHLQGRPYVVPRPYAFWVSLRLFEVDSGAEPAEVHTFMFNQPVVTPE